MSVFSSVKEPSLKIALDRYADGVRKQIPFAKFQYVDVEFTTADTDVDIAHKLDPTNPDKVIFIPVTILGDAYIYRDGAIDRAAWQNTHIFLRASDPCFARILLCLPITEVGNLPAVAPGGGGGGGGAAAAVDILFRPFQQEPPATSYAYLDTRNNRPCLVFIDGSSTSIMFSGLLPSGYGGNGLDVTLYIGSPATTGEARFEVSFEAVVAQSLDSDGFATAKTIDITVSGTTLATSGTISFSNSEIDGLLAGGLFRIKVTRLGAHANDDAADIAQLLFVHIAETP